MVTGHPRFVQPIFALRPAPEAVYRPALEAVRRAGQGTHRTVRGSLPKPPADVR